MAFADDVANVILFTLCGLSMISAASVFLSGIIFGSWKTHRGRLVLYIMATETAAGAEKFFAFVNCTVEAWLCQVAMVSSFFWKLCFSITLYLAVVHNKKDRFLNWIEPVYHIVAWGFPLVTATICEVTHSFGKAGLWCWIKADAPEFRMGFFYVPLICIMILMLIVYAATAISIRIKIRKTKYLRTDSSFRKELVIYQRLSLFILAFVAGRIWSVFNRGYEMISGQSNYYLFLFHTIGSYSQGLFSSIVYGAVERYPQHYWAIFRCCCRWCKKKIGKRRSSLSFSASSDFSGMLSTEMSSSRNISRPNSVEPIELDDPVSLGAENVLTESLLSQEQREEMKSSASNNTEPNTTPSVLPALIPGVDSNHQTQNE